MSNNKPSGDLISRDAILASLRESLENCRDWMEHTDSETKPKAEQAYLTFTECILRIIDAPKVEPEEPEENEPTFHVISSRGEGKTAQLIIDAYTTGKSEGLKYAERERQEMSDEITFLRNTLKKETRPEAEWIKNSDGNFICSYCGKRREQCNLNFCGHCGARIINND